MRDSIIISIFLIWSATYSIQSNADESNAGEDVSSRQHIITLGIGKNKGEAEGTPFSLGVLFNYQEPIFWGLDISSEGELLNTTGNSVTTEAGFSFNFHLGANLISEGLWTVGVSAIAGVRQNETGCNRQSYLGFDCYADEDPTGGYEFNGGGQLTVTYQSFSIGVRATDASTQLVLGLAL